MASSHISRTLLQQLRYLNQLHCLSFHNHLRQTTPRLRLSVSTHMKYCSSSKSQTLFDSKQILTKDKDQPEAKCSDSYEYEHANTNSHLFVVGNAGSSLQDRKEKRLLQEERDDITQDVLQNKEDLSECSDSELMVEFDSELEKLPRKVFEPEYHLGAYVNESKTLTQLVKLGADLSMIQQIDGAADMVIKLDFEKEVKPYLFFLHDLGVSDEEIGDYISRNPLIFKEQLDDLQSRVQYLRSKKFSKDAIARIVSTASVFLLLTVKQVDSKLGYFQKEYKLTGNDVRYVVTKQPRLITWNQHKLKDNRFYMKEFLGFSDVELTEILLSCPKVLLTNKYAMGKKFDFLYNTMEISHRTLTQWPNVFRCRLHILQQRHRFLLSVDRAQYDPAKPNFVSLQALVSGLDTDFCTSVARTSVAQFNNFLKSI